MHAQLLSHVRFSVTPWTVAHQAPLSMDFPCKNTRVGTTMDRSTKQKINKGTQTLKDTMDQLDL